MRTDERAGINAPLQGAGFRGLFTQGGAALALGYIDSPFQGWEGGWLFPLEQLDDFLVITVLGEILRRLPVRILNVGIGAMIQ